jgi:hypothetical protein
MTDAPPQDIPKDELSFVRAWLEAIQLSEDEEKEWRDNAQRACDAYRGGKASSTSLESGTNLNTFNIFHSNIETMVPALYNSTPIPDVRRRYNDPDPVAREVSEIFERAISYQIDAYDFDNTMLSCVRDMAITSRGIARVRYVPSFDQQGNVAYEEVTCEYTPWKTFRRGPGRVWDEVPWIAFELYLSHGEVEKLVEGEKGGAALLKELKFTYTAEPKKSAEQQGENLSKLAARARVWEIWDKDNRKVHFICPDYTSRRLTSVDDPLELISFFPIPRPISALIAPDSLVPITLLQIYEKLLEELNEVQRRILRLTKQLRVRGGYAGVSEDIKAITEADDGELVPLQSAEMFAQTGGGIDKAITWFPLEPIVKALEQLVIQRESIKQTIYEVTGLSDLMRGASDARETATAQQIKSQWGSQRIQRMQAEVSRFARDLFRMKAEIMAKKFAPETFWMMTGQKYPTQQEKQMAQQQFQQGQQAVQSGQLQMTPELQAKAKEIQELLAKPGQEEVIKLIKSDATRGFRVDIESDSTIRGDLQKNQEQMGQFLEGTASYLKAVGPLVQQGAMPQDIAIEIFAAFCRSFRLGKQAEDALDRLADAAKKGGGEQKKPSPEEIKAQAEERKMQMEMELKKAELELKKQEVGIKLQEAQAKMQLEVKKAELEMQLKQMEAQQDAQLKEREAEQNAMMAQQQAAADAERKQIEFQNKSQLSMEQAMFDRTNKQAAFDEDRQRKAQSFEEEQEFKRRQMMMQEHAQRADHSARDAQRGKPRRLKILNRDADGRPAEAEVN